MSDPEHVPGLGQDVNALLFHSVLNTNATRLWIATHDTVFTQKCVNTVSDLLENGADPDIADSKNKQTPLSLAAEYGDHILCKKLCESNADPNIPDVKGRTPLNFAMLKDDLDLCQLLCDFRADTNISFISDFRRDSILIWAIRNKKTLPLCELLCKYGADTNREAPYDGATPLQLATQSNNMPLCELLLKYKADVNKYDRLHGRNTPLLGHLRKQQL